MKVFRFFHEHQNFAASVNGLVHIIIVLWNGTEKGRDESSETEGLIIERRKTKYTEILNPKQNYLMQQIGYKFSEDEVKKVLDENFLCLQTR